MGKGEIQHIELSLKERVKELECLYAISQVNFDMQESPVHELLSKIIGFLPRAWQYPEITHAHINYDQTDFFTKGYKNSEYKQIADIFVNGEKKGLIEICYSEKMPDSFEGPFLREERSLLNTIAKELSIIIAKKKQAEEKRVLEARLRHSDRLATIGEFSSGIAHELNEPLTTILGFAQLIKNDIENIEQARADIDKIIDAAFHARNIVRKLMTFAKTDEMEDKPIKLNSTIEQGIYLLESRCRKNNIKLVTLFENGIPLISVNPVRINQVIINLVVNSIQAMPEGGNIILQTKRNNGNVSIIVQDDGIGMSEKTLKRMYDPFFTTKDSQLNTGLGLSVVHGIISTLKGEIKVESNLGIGTRFEIIIPVASENK